jgi:hypothetical protein
VSKYITDSFITSNSQNIDKSLHYTEPLQKFKDMKALTMITDNYVDMALRFISKKLDEEQVTSITQKLDDLKDDHCIFYTKSVNNISLRRGGFRTLKTKNRSTRRRG